MPKNERVRKINLFEITGTAKNNEEIKNRVRQQIPQYLFFDHRIHVLAFHGLKVFNLGKTKYQINDMASLENACAKILEISSIYEKKIILPVFKRIDDISDHEPIKHFVIWVMGFFQMPFLVLRELERKVRKDFKILNRLVKEYEEELIIKNYIDTGEKRNEHETKTKLDFYKRCIQERELITDYLANGIEARAIAKASIDHESKLYPAFWNDENFDRPYRWWALQSMEYFDYRKINLCRHRIEGSIAESRELQALYKKGEKQKFYNRLKKTLTPQQIFHGILTYYIKMVPNIEQREPIFKELQGLFRSKKWYGFTALALTQVEGLFSDMVSVTRVPKRVSSLPTKVNAIRGLYKIEGRSFDYFEYHLPRHRNRFLHYGQMADENFKMLAYDLLYDLNHLMETFHQLKDPHVELHKLLKKNSLDFLNSLGDFVGVFRLVKTIQDRLKKSDEDKLLNSILEEWKKFERDIISPSGYAELYLALAEKIIDDRMQSFFGVIALGTEYAGERIDLAKMSLGELEANKEKILKVIKEVAYPDYDIYSFLVECIEFIDNYKKYLPHSSNDVKVLAESIKARHQENFRKLIVINRALFLAN